MLSFMQIAKSKEFTIFNLLFLPYAYYCYSYGFSFDLGWNEALELYESYHPLTAHINPFNTELRFPTDRGIFIPGIIKLFMEYTGDNFSLLRIFPISMHLLCFIFCFFILFKKYSVLVKVTSIALLFFNYDFYLKSNLINPYSVSTFLVMVLFYVHLRFVPNKKFFFFHSLLGLAAVASFFTALLPFVASTILLIKVHRRAFFKKIYFYIPVIIFSLVKGYMIFGFRFVKRKGNSEFLNGTILENITQILEFFNLNLNWYNTFMGSELAYKLAVIIVIYSLPFYLSHIFKSKCKIHQLCKYYLILTISSYIIMNLTGAHEIKMRYYFALLPLFAVTYSSYLYSKKNIWQTFYSIPLLICLIIINYSSFIKIDSYSGNMPMTKITNYLNKLNLDNDVVCFTDYLGNEDLAWKLSQVGYSRGKIKVKKLDSIYSCKKRVKKTDFEKVRHIYLVSFSKRYDENLSCESENRQNCINSNFVNEINSRNKISSHIISSNNRNSNVFIEVYSN